MHKGWSSMEEVPYCFWGLSVKFQGHTGQIIAKFDSIVVKVLCANQWNEPVGSYLKLTDIVWVGFQKQKPNTMTNQREMLAIEGKRLALKER